MDTEESCLLLEKQGIKSAKINSFDSFESWGYVLKVIVVSLRNIIVIGGKLEQRQTASIVALFRQLHAKNILTGTPEFKYFVPDNSSTLKVTKLFLEPFMDVYNSEIISYKITH